MVDSFSNSKELIDGLSLREIQERRRVTGDIAENQKWYINPLQARGVGEYAPSRKDLIERVKIVRKYFNFDKQEKEFYDRHLAVLEKYEKMGLQLGVLFGTISAFLPGIRRTPFYIRGPFALASFAFCVNWGKNYGTDVVFMRMRPSLEFYEQRMGSRHRFSLY